MRREIGGANDDLSIFSEEEVEEEYEGLFTEGQACDLCGKPGRVGIDPTCRGNYDGEPKLACFDCAPSVLKDAFAEVQGMSAIVEPLEDYDVLWYYRIDEMASYQFVREDLEGISWLLLTVGGPCSRCGEQSRHAWLTSDVIDPKLPEGKAVFRNLDSDTEALCNGCAAGAINDACKAIDMPLIAIEVPRSAMGVLIPTGE